MRMTERVEEIIVMNTEQNCIPLVLWDEKSQVYPMYYARIIGEKKLAFPVTNATGISGVLTEESPAKALVSDREDGYEAYLLEGRARYVTDESDFQLVAEMRNVAPGLPVHGAVVFEIDNVHLVPPP